MDAALRPRLPSSFTALHPDRSSQLPTRASPARWRKCQRGLPLWPAKPVSPAEYISSCRKRVLVATTPTPYTVESQADGPTTVVPENGNPGEDSFMSSPGVMDNSSIMSMDWNDWMMSSSSSSSDGGDGLLSLTDGVGGSDGAAAGGDAAAGQSAAAASAASPATAAAAASVTATIRIAFYAVAASFDRRQLETRLRAAYGNHAVRKYPDVIHCQLCRGREGQPGMDAFFFDYGVVACWGMAPDTERELVQNLAVQCAVQPLPERGQERDVFRCTFATAPLELERGAGGGAGGGAGRAAVKPMVTPVVAAAVPAAPAVAAAAPPPSTTAVDPLGSILDVEYGTGGSLGSTSGTISSRRYTRRAERSGGAVAAVTAAAVAAPALPAPMVAVPPPPPPPLPVAEPPAAVGPFSFLSFPPKISDDTVLLHVRHCGDTATLLAVSYALAQSTKLSAFEKAVEAIVEETRGLPEALAEHGEVHLSGREVGRLLGKVFVLKRSVNLRGSVAETPEFFWYAPDQLQSLYTRITEYVELSDRVEQLNARFSVLQELLELLRAQEENRHGNRLEWTVIWLIVVEVVLGLFELAELFGVIGPQHGGGGF